MVGNRRSVRVVSKIGYRGRFFEELERFCDLATYACTEEWLGGNSWRIANGGKRRAR